MAVDIKYNYGLRGHNTFGMDVKARRFITYDTVDELTELLADLRTTEQRILHIGRGSNLLFTGDYDGTILHSNIKGMEYLSRTDKDIVVRVGAGVVWDDFCAEMARNNYYGSENLSLIPGEVGAAAVQNIGAYGVEAESIVQSVETIEIATGKPRVFEVAECGYGYRESVFKSCIKGQYIVTAVVFHLHAVPVVHLDYGPLQALKSQNAVPLPQEIRDAVIAIRRAKLPDPEQTGSAGSFFKNPVVPAEVYRQIASAYGDVPHYVLDDAHVKIPAAWLIDQCGWKGKSYGGAAVHDKQALILVNKDHATPAHIMELASLITRSVRAKFNIQLEPEVNYI